MTSVKTRSAPLPVAAPAIKPRAITPQATPDPEARGWSPRGGTNQEAINHFAPKGTSWATATARAKEAGIDLNAAAANRNARVALKPALPSSADSAQRRTNQDVINHYTSNGVSWAAASALAKKDGVDLNAAARNRTASVETIESPPSQGPRASFDEPAWTAAGHTNQEAINHYSAATASWADAVELAKEDGVNLYAAVKDRAGQVSVEGGNPKDLLGLSELAQLAGERQLSQALGAGFERITGEAPIDAVARPLEALMKEGTFDNVLSMDDLLKGLAADFDRLGDEPAELELSKEVQSTITAMELRADKAGPRTITADVLRKIVPGLSGARAQELVPHLNKAMADAKITTPRQQAAFIAQCAHETGGFKTLKEYGGPKYFKKYDGRLDLGNTKPGDGARYAGRGALQLTGRANYTAASKALYGDRRLVDHPELAEKPEAAFAVSTWFWNTRKLNTPAEAGDLKKVTRRVNGGMNGWPDRLALYTRALNELGATTRP